MKKLSTLILTVLLGNLSNFAQSMIEGSIVNSAGESVVATVVTMQHKTNDELSKAITVDESGYFIMDDLADGVYNLAVENVDYETILIADFQFPRDTDKVLGLTMEHLELTSTALTIKRNDRKDNIANSNVY